MHYQNDNNEDQLFSQRMVDTRPGHHTDSLSKLSLIYLQLQSVKQMIQQNTVERSRARDLFTPTHSMYLNPE